MLNFDPASALSSRGNSADEGAIIRMAQKTRELRAKGHDVVALTLGEPDFDTPLNIRDAAKLALDQGQTHYAPVAGIAELREAIAAKLRSENGLDYQATNVVVANGAKQALANAVLSLVGPGDEVVIPAPFWLSYEGTVNFAGGKAVVLPSTVAENYKVPVERIAAAITHSTKLLLLNSPSNPTGAIWTRAELEAIAEIVRKHPRLMVLSDEIYEYIVFDGEMVSFGTLPGMLERTITLNGFSKGFAMTGWRIGYAAAAEPIAKSMARMQSIISAGGNAFSQHAAVTALKGHREDVAKMREAYRTRRDFVVAALRGIEGVKIASIPGTFYAFPDISIFLGRRADIKTSDQLCDWLVENHGVATVPGSAFGAPNSIRLSFATNMENLKKAVERLSSGLATLRLTIG